jgi:TolB-like protein/Flp pilus assembly protein TadD
MSRFLRFAVSETLAGRAASLKEYRFGVEVFDRPESFDPGMDPIVRVEARRLRTKLARYYEVEGRADEVIIELPKGGYVPAFGNREQQRVSPPAEADANRLAVLPFVDLTGSEEASYLADGLTWELIHGLTRLRNLAVLAWHSSSQLRGERQPDIGAVREKLQVQWVVAGSVRRWREQLRVVAQLIDASTGVYLWSETYERSADHAADIQQEISHAIVDTLRVRLGGAQAPVTAAPAYNPEAYGLYLLARGRWNARTETGLREALDGFRRAVAIDSNFAAAYAGMADTYALLGEYGIEQPSRMVALAKTSALRALEIDPTLGEAHCSLGLLAGLYEWKWREAESHLRRALDLNPGYATAHHWIAVNFLPVVGRLEEAAREIDIALALDPLSPIIAEGKAFLHLCARDYGQAEAELQHIIDANPGFYRAWTSLGRLYIQMGFYEKALEALERGRQQVGDLPTILGAMGQAYGLIGDTGKAREVVSSLEALRKSRYAPSTCLALAHLGLGEQDRAIEWLATGLDCHEGSIPLIHVHPAYDGLRTHPVFPSLVARLGLPA